jgi:hypothetical protein
VFVGGTGVPVGKGVWVDGMGVFVGRGVRVGSGVFVGADVRVGAGVKVAVAVGVSVGLGVLVGVRVFVAVTVGVRVAMAVGVRVDVTVGGRAGVLVGKGVSVGTGVDAGGSVVHPIRLDVTTTMNRKSLFGLDNFSSFRWFYGCSVWAAGSLSYSSSDKMAIARWMSAICRGPLISRSMVSAPL